MKNSLDNMLALMNETVRMDLDKNWEILYNYGCRLELQILTLTFALSN